MSDTQNAVSQISKFVETVANLGASVARVGVAVVTAPLSLLPQPTRTDATKATNDFVGAVGNFQLSIVKATIGGLNSLVESINKAISPTK